MCCCFYCLEVHVAYWGMPCISRWYSWVMVYYVEIYHIGICRWLVDFGEMCPTGICTCGRLSIYQIEHKITKHHLQSY
jgi:hypothetical protein